MISGFLNVIILLVFISHHLFVRMIVIVLRLKCFLFHIVNSAMELENSAMEFFNALIIV